VLRGIPVTSSDLRISVVIPTYNRERTIKRCLESVFKQTFPPYEVVVIDDCSTDNTAEIVKTFFDERLRFIRMPKNRGAQAARNLGIVEAKGEWIAFQDSDDVWLPDKLRKQVDLLFEVHCDPLSVIHTKAIKYDVKTKSQEIFEPGPVQGETAYRQLLMKPGPLFPTLLTSQKALFSIGLLDEKVPSYQEWDTSIRLAKTCKWHYIDEPLFVYYLHEDETISKNLKRDIDGYQYVIDKFRDEIIKVHGEHIYFTHLKNNIFRAMNYGLWEKAQSIVNAFNGKGPFRMLTQFLLSFHIKPKYLALLKQRIYLRKLYRFFYG